MVETKEGGVRGGILGRGGLFVRADGVGGWTKKFVGVCGFWTRRWLVGVEMGGKLELSLLLEGGRGTERDTACGLFEGFCGVG